MAVSFVGAAFFADVFGGIVPIETTRYYFLAVCSIIMSVVLLCGHNRIRLGRSFVCSLLLALLVILYFVIFRTPYINYVKCLSFLCLFISLCQLNKEERAKLTLLFPVISSLFCIILLFSKLFRQSMVLFEGYMWYDNIAGPLLVVSIGVAFLFPFLADSRVRMRVLAVLLLLMHFFVAFIFQSRTSLLSMIVVSSVYCWVSFSRSDRRFIMQTSIGLIVVAAIAFCTLMITKSDSSDGRLLIWKIAIDASFSTPLFGHGPGSFLSDYMSYQAIYFQYSNNIHHAMIAGNVYHPFNEFILVFFQYGFVGLLVLFAVIACFVYSYSGNISTMLCLVVLFSYSCFSYPSKYAFFWLTLMFLLSDIVNRDDNDLVSNEKAKKLVLGCAIGSLLCITAADLSFNIRWKHCYDEYERDAQSSLKEYRQLSRYWNNEPGFLYNWAISNYQSHNYKACIGILDVCRLHLDDYNVEMLYGNCLEQMKRYDEALLHFNSCRNMCPSMFMPDYKLFEIYSLIGDSANAVSAAESLLEKIPKVENSAYNVMKSMANDYLESRQ